MNIVLSPQMQQFLEEKVKAGQYASPSEVIDSALVTLKELEELTPDVIDELRRELQLGIEQLDRGEGQPWDADAVKARVREHATRVRGNA